MDAPRLAATKFTPPRLPGALVSRPRLVQRVDEGVKGALTLIAAPAGAGKSALLSEWVSQRPDARVGWLALDPADRDPRRFWRGVMEALRRAGVGEPAASLEVHPSGARDLLLPALVDALETPGEPVVLILDDFHELNPAPVLAGIDELLRRPPNGLRLVIASRADPPLRLGRLRLSGDLAEIRESDLSLTLA